MPVTGLSVCATFPAALRLSQATVFATRESISLFTSHWLPSGGTNLSRTVMTFLDFPLSLEQSITRAWQSKPLCKMNLLRDIFISRIYATREVEKKKRKERRGRVGGKWGLLDEQNAHRQYRSGSALSLQAVSESLKLCFFFLVCKLYSQFICSEMFKSSAGMSVKRREKNYSKQSFQCRMACFQRKKKKKQKSPDAFSSIIRTRITCHQV